MSSIEQEGGSDSSDLAHVDWLAFTVPKLESDQNTLSVVDSALQRFIGLSHDMWKQKGQAGWNGYQHGIALGAYGLLGHGGESQRGTVHVSLNAQACARVEDWKQVAQWHQKYGVKLTRVDAAHDDLDGLVVNIEAAKAKYLEGGFHANGRPPSIEVAEDWITCHSRTVYVGKRRNGTFLR